MKNSSYKRKTKTWRLTFLAVCFSLLLIPNSKAYCQPIISAGVGLPELLNLSIKFPFEQVQFGISYGIATGIVFGSNDHPPTCFAADVRYYFGGKSKFSLRQPWYGKLGLCFYNTENDKYINEYIYFNPRIGREFNFTKKFGIELDLGAIIELAHNQTRKVPPSLWEFGPILDFPVLPSASTSLFFRL